MCSARLQVPGTPASIGVVRRALAAVAERAGASRATIANVRLAVSEATTNAVRHAYDDGGAPGDVMACARVERPDGEDASLVVTVSDHGGGVRPRPDSPGLGLGLPLMAQVTTALDVANRGDGATVCMRFALP